MVGDLARAWKRSKKMNGWENQEDIAADVREAFLRFVQVPEGMAEELSGYFLPGTVDEDSVYKSEEVLEILGLEWTPQGSALDDDDWDFLRDLVNAWALELDMDIVTGVMRTIVDRGGFSGG
jgi:hypothetical protein